LILLKTQAGKRVKLKMRVVFDLDERKVDGRGKIRVFLIRLNETTILSNFKKFGNIDPGKKM